MGKESSSTATPNLFDAKTFGNGPTNPCGRRGAAQGGKTPSPGLDCSEDKFFGCGFCLTHFEDHLGSIFNVEHSFILYGDPPSGTPSEVSSYVATGLGNLQKDASGGQLSLQPASKLEGDDTMVDLAETTKCSACKAPTKAVACSKAW